MNRAQNIYDNQEFFDGYKKLRGNQYSANNLEEIPALLDLQGKAVLDLGCGYRLSGWAKYNRILEYNAPCQKDIGFFFMPVHIAAELVRSWKNSEVDALIDMWINTVYNDPKVKGSDAACT